MHTRPEKILDDHWNLIQKCWSWEAGHRPGTTKVLQCIDQFRTDNLQGRQPKVLTGQGLADLTGQIIGSIGDFVAAGDFGIVYKCEWKRPAGPVKVCTMLVSIDDIFIDYRAAGCSKSH
jgi:hypothetical protein